METSEPQWDAHLEQADEDTHPGSGERDPSEEEEIDPELEAWLRAREADLAEHAFAWADQFGEEWSR